MSLTTGLRTKGDISLDDIKTNDLQYLYSTPIDPPYYLKYRVIREPYLNTKGVWEWVCKSVSNSSAFIIFRITPGLDDAPLLFSKEPKKAKLLR